MDFEDFLFLIMFIKNHDAIKDINHKTIFYIFLQKVTVKLIFF